jgi:hypothetical protein
MERRGQVRDHVAAWSAFHLALRGKVRYIPPAKTKRAGEEELAALLVDERAKWQKVIADNHIEVN